MKLTSSAQEARRLAFTPSQSSAGSEKVRDRYAPPKVKPVACQPPYAQDSELKYRPSRDELMNKPARLDASLLNNPSGLDSVSLFHISGPRGVKPIPREGSDIFGGRGAMSKIEKETHKKLWFQSSSRAFFDGRQGQKQQYGSTWLWHPYNKPLYMAPYAGDKPGPPEIEEQKPWGGIAGLNSVELSVVSNYPVARGVKPVPRPDSNIFGVDEDTPFSTGQEVGFRYPSMLKVAQLERQLKPHRPKQDEAGMRPSLSAPDLHEAQSCKSCGRKSHRSHRRHRSHQGADPLRETR